MDYVTAYFYLFLLKDKFRMQLKDVFEEILPAPLIQTATFCRWYFFYFFPSKPFSYNVGVKRYFASMIPTDYSALCALASLRSASDVCFTP